MSKIREDMTRFIAYKLLFVLNILKKYDIELPKFLL